MSRAIAKIPVESAPEAPEDLMFVPSELYHENSKLRFSDKSLYSWIGFVLGSVPLRAIVSRPFSHYSRSPRIELSRDFIPTSKSFEDVVTERRSNRDFTGESISLDALAKLLYLGDGITALDKAPDGTQWAFRTAPSGGGLYPVDLYCIVNRVEGLAPGVYFYDPLGHALEQLSSGDLSRKLTEATFMGDTASRASVCIVMTGVFARSRFKYGERSYRFVMMEAGHIGQNLLLAAQASGMGAVAVGGFVDDAINRMLSLDGVREAALYVVLAGVPMTP